MKNQYGSVSKSIDLENTENNSHILIEWMKDGEFKGRVIFRDSKGSIIAYNEDIASIYIQKAIDSQIFEITEDFFMDKE